MTREEPSLETLWLENIRMMDKVQLTNPSKTDKNNGQTLENQTSLDKLNDTYAKSYNLLYTKLLCCSKEAVFSSDMTSYTCDISRQNAAQMMTMAYATVKSLTSRMEGFGYNLYITTVSPLWIY
jgi:hypothetical protein